jgi:hypothetical protein
VLATLVLLTAVLVALLGAASAEAKPSTNRPLRDARSLHGPGTEVAAKHRARHRQRGVARHHAVVRKHRHRGKRRHGAHSQPAGPTAGSPADPTPITAPGAPLLPSLANPAPSQAPARNDQTPPRGGDAAAPPPAGQHGVDPDPEPELPPAGEPEPPAEEPGTPPAEEPEPPAEEPEPPKGEEPEPPKGEEPEPPKEEPEPPKGEEPEPPKEEPEPPQQEPEPPSAGLLFRGDQIRDFVVQAAKGAITEVPDPLGSGQTVFEMTVDDDDVAPVTPTENPRAQMISPDLIEAGDEFWLKTKFLIPENFPAVTGWMSMLSIYGPPFNSSSPWQIELIGDHLQWTRNRTYDFDVPWQAPLVKGSWVTVLTHERFAADGFIEMWINGQPVSFFGRETRLEMKTMDSSNGTGTNSIRISQYRQAGMFETGTTYFGPVLLGTTRAAVEG